MRYTGKLPVPDSVKTAIEFGTPLPMEDYEPLTDEFTGVIAQPPSYRQERVLLYPNYCGLMSRLFRGIISADELAGMAPAYGEKSATILEVHVSSIVHSPFFCMAPRAPNG
jgi:hypothetical protein